MYVMGAELTDGHCIGVASEEERKREQAREPLERRHVVLERVKEREVNRMWGEVLLESR
jgi:hypothetical protein